MPQRSTDYDIDAILPPGGGDPGAEEAGGDQRTPAAILAPAAGVASAPAAAAAARVENHPSPDNAPVPVAQLSASIEAEKGDKKGVEEIDASGEDVPVPFGMMDTSYDQAEKGGARTQGAMKSVELAHQDNEGPVPPGQVSDDGGDSKIEAKKASSAAASRNVRARAAAIIDAKSAASSAAQPRVATGPSGMRDGGEDAQPTLVAPTVRPPPPSMLPTPDLEEPTVPSFHEVHATLVEDEPEQPVYDAVPVEEEHWAKRHQRKIVGGFVLVIIAMAVALGVAFGIGTGGGEDADATVIFATTPPTRSLSPSSPPTRSLSPSNQPSMYPRRCFADKEELKAAVDDYTAGGIPCFAGDTECEVIQTYGWPIGTWCTSNVTDMSELFSEKTGFNEDLSSWDTSKVTTMERMFGDAGSFNGDVSTFDTSKVTSMVEMFKVATAFNGDVSSFDTSKVTSMAYMFNQATSFNGDVSHFDTSKATSMAYMFARAYAFNGDVSNFDTSKVTSMVRMFYRARAFNVDVSNWDTSLVTSMWRMFGGATAFNQDVSNWDTSKVASMQWMFQYASAFNQDVSRWDVASVTDMREMFFDASSFNQNLCAWGVHYNATVSSWAWGGLSIGPYDDMFLGTSCPNQNDPVGPETKWCAATCYSTEQNPNL